MYIFFFFFLALNGMVLLGRSGWERRGVSLGSRFTVFVRKRNGATIMGASFLPALRSLSCNFACKASISRGDFWA